jgi:phospholipid/cholesterol/gamma-HCH transport system ATP-binding protein
MIEIRSLHKSFNGKDVLNGVTLSIEDGKITTIIGQSGCGKSVLLKHMVGLHEPDKGEVAVNGDILADMDEEARRRCRSRFSYLFQGGALFDSLTVWENVVFPLVWEGGHHHHYDKKELQQKAAETLELVGMAHVESLKPSELSGGMKKRVALARAIVHNPEYILYDEPTTGLDPVMSAVIDDLILTLNKELGLTSVVVTHDMQSVSRVSDEVCMLYGGRIVFNGSVSRMKQDKNPVLQQFIQRKNDGPILFGQ